MPALHKLARRRGGDNSDTCASCCFRSSLSQQGTFRGAQGLLVSW